MIKKMKHILSFTFKSNYSCFTACLKYKSNISYDVFNKLRKFKSKYPPSSQLKSNLHYKSKENQYPVTTSLQYAFLCMLSCIKYPLSLSRIKQTIVEIFNRLLVEQLFEWVIIFHDAHLLITIFPC